jgi:uncharacterized membrane protein YfhO
MDKIKLILIIFFFFIISYLGHFYFLNNNPRFYSPAYDMHWQFAPFIKLLLESFSKGDFFWSWSYGLGGDLWGAFNYYYSGTPVFWLIYIFYKNASFSEILDLRLTVSILKIACIMISMFVLLRYKKISYLSSSLGAVTYGLNIYNLNKSFIFDYMIDSLLWLPILIIGIEKVFKYRSITLFVLVNALSIFANFYFAYINSIFIFIYVIFYLITNRDNLINTKIKDFFFFCYLYLISLAISSIMFLPSVYQFLQTERVAEKIDVSILFEINYYKTIFYHWFMPNDFSFTRSYIQLGLPILLFVFLLIGFFVKDKNIKSWYYFSLFWLSLYFIEFTYSIFNGFSVPQSRWLYLIILVLSIYMASIIDAINNNKITTNILKGSAIVSSVFFVVILKYKKEIFNVHVNEVDIIMLSFLVCFLLFTNFKSRFPQHIYSKLIAALIIINLIFNANVYSFQFIANEFNQKNATDAMKSGIRFENEEQIKIIEQLKKDKKFSRIYQSNIINNTPMIQSYKGLSTYQSLVDKNTVKFFYDSYHLLQDNDNKILLGEIDQRFYIENFLNVKYMVFSKELINKIKHLSTLKKLFETRNFVIYENPNMAPLGFLVSEKISKQQFNKMNQAEKDQALFKSVVLEKEDFKESNTIKSMELKHINPIRTSINLNNINYLGNNKYQVLSDGNFNLKTNGSRLFHSKELGEWLLETEIERMGKNNNFTLSINNRNFNKKDKSNTYSYPLKKIVFNLGSGKFNDLNIKLTPGIYKIKKMELLFNSYNSYYDFLAKKQQIKLAALKVNNNQINGIFNAKKDSIAVFSIPYSKGWTATINGKEVQPIKVNNNFIGLPISVGKSKIKLVYITPYFKIGLVTTTVGLFMWILTNYLIRKRAIKSNKM